ncbi:hypothetical protein AM587_10016904 [Phytophthora nicotianae]|uniref:Uncharacterized protein n=1 Tax=Phytophthora nicotianae TaxID=4792 RepID=A0A0W8AYN4_PHYNI|nr:hypothetical protein AM587_10016904 [Phytophthora nicotianae]
MEKSPESRAPEPYHGTSNCYKSSSGTQTQDNLIFMERLYARKVLNLLRLTEFTILVEYIEVVVPIVYSIYVVAMSYFPNRIYYTQLAHMDADKLQSTLSNVILYSFLEFISLVVLILFLRRTAVVVVLGVTCALDYDKPEAARLAAAGATLLVYFRSTGLFVRLMLFVSAIVFYGDIIIPIIRLARGNEVIPLPTTKLMLHCIWVWNTCRGRMRGGQFLFPLYVEPEDAAAADAPESLHPVTSNPVAGDEPFNPQRLATLIRSSTTNAFGPLAETTEIAADVLNSLPRWAQAVVQTGCFNGS